MNSRMRMNVGLWALILAASNCMLAETSGTDALATQADAIVVGEVQSGQQTDRSLSFLLTISRVIKGNLVNGTTISVQWEAAWRGNGSLNGDYGMWFLQKTQIGTWTLLPVKQGRVPFQSSYFALSKANSPALLGSNLTPVSTNDVIAVELTTAIQHYNDLNQMSDLAYGLLRTSNSALMADLYRTLSSSSDRELKFLGLTGLVRMKDASALVEIARNADAIPNLKTSEFPLSAIRSVRDNSPTTIQALAQMTSSHSTIVQGSAAEALRDIHTRETLPALGQLLESSDPATREAAIKGFSLFVENLPITTPQSIPSQAWRVPQGPAPYRSPETDLYSLSTRVLDPAKEAIYLQFW